MSQQGFQLVTPQMGVDSPRQNNAPAHEARGKRLMLRCCGLAIDGRPGIDQRETMYDVLARIIHESLGDLPNMLMEKQLRLSCLKHRANQPPRASVRFSRNSREPWARAQRLLIILR